jgi:hypothetical protein
MPKLAASLCIIASGSTPVLLSSALSSVSSNAQMCSHVRISAITSKRVWCFGIKETSSFYNATDAQRSGWARRRS